MKDLDEIRQRVSLVTLAEAAGARFGDGHRLRSHCPLPHHAGDRSSLAFVIYEDGRKWKCHSSCPPDVNGGDVIAFYMAWKGVDFKTAVEELAEWSEAAVPSQTLPALQPKPRIQPRLWVERAEKFVSFAEENLKKDQGAQEYLRYERGLSPATWKAFRLGYNPGNLYDNPAKWGLDAKKVWLSRGIVIPGFSQERVSYVKIRRPLPGDVLGKFIGEWTPKDGNAEIKFGGPRGGRSIMFRLELTDHLPILVLTEGEWDAMLLWEHCADLCDMGTIGGAQAKFSALDLTLLSRYLAILVVHDDDKAGAKGRKYISELRKISERIISVPPPAHDLTEYWKAGGDLRGWVAEHVLRSLENALGQSGQLRPERAGKILANITAELLQVDAT